MEGLSSAFTEYCTMNLGFSFDWNLSYSINWWWMSNWPDLVLQNVHLRWYIQVRHLFLSHLCKHLWVQGFAYDNIHSGCCSDKSGHLWERRDDGYLMSSSINGVRLLHAWQLPSFTQRQVSPMTQQLTNNLPSQVFTAFSLSSYRQQIHQ